MNQTILATLYDLQGMPIGQVNVPIEAKLVHWNRSFYVFKPAPILIPGYGDYYQTPMFVPDNVHSMPKKG